MTHNFFERIQNFALTEHKRIIVRDHRGSIHGSNYGVMLGALLSYLRGETQAP